MAQNGLTAAKPTTLCITVLSASCPPITMTHASTSNQDHQHLLSHMKTFD